MQFTELGQVLSTHIMYFTKQAVQLTIKVSLEASLSIIGLGKRMLSSIDPRFHGYALPKPLGSSASMVSSIVEMTGSKATTQVSKKHRHDLLWNQVISPCPCLITQQFQTKTLQEARNRIDARPSRKVEYHLQQLVCFVLYHIKLDTRCRASQPFLVKNDCKPVLHGTTQTLSQAITV